MEFNGKTLQLHAVYKKLHFYYNSSENLYQVLQVTCAETDKIEGSYDEIITSIV